MRGPQLGLSSSLRVDATRKCLCEETTPIPLTNRHYSSREFASPCGVCQGMTAIDVIPSSVSNELKGKVRLFRGNLSPTSDFAKTAAEVISPPVLGPTGLSAACVTDAGSFREVQNPNTVA